MSLDKEKQPDPLSLWEIIKESWRRRHHSMKKQVDVSLKRIDGFVREPENAQDEILNIMIVVAQLRDNEELWMELHRVAFENVERKVGDKGLVKETKDGVEHYYIKFATYSRRKLPGVDAFGLGYEDRDIKAYSTNGSKQNEFIIAPSNILSAKVKSV